MFTVTLLATIYATATAAAYLATEALGDDISRRRVIARRLSRFF